ncbi:RidA family protein [Microbulbifer spongiae]|uniref:Rid family hydrolase n=1 Tax=Microbulbifer spongiae TaxID=2944933 RepID=A0ABY9E999_9GAMM|nr:RidA family protein [Microbulbifer sp. MI-G]WKD49257.1 Rid family hydrolase [Microbulbifer sp. MI-G]
MTFHPPAESFEVHGCPIVLRCIEGSRARELFLHCQAPTHRADVGTQAAAIYRAIQKTLSAKGGSIASIISEMVFLQNLPENIAPVRKARAQVLAASGEKFIDPARTEIGQPPLHARAHLEVLVQAIIPGTSIFSLTTVKTAVACGSTASTTGRGLRVQLEDETRVLAGGLCSAGDNAHEQTYGVLELAESLLQQSGLAFSDVVRTWIHLRDIDRDYNDLNRARRAFFDSRGIGPAPASTAIGSILAFERHKLCLGFYAVKRPNPVERIPMRSPTLNEAPEYGADFVRGMRVTESNKIMLIVSGTASIDQAGRSAHVGDCSAQTDRMLANIRALLKGQGATFQDIVFAITYVKRPADQLHLLHKFRSAGFEGFPNVWVQADVCRPELLCETELIAVLPCAR